MGSLSYWAVGFAFAFGDSDNGFIGTSNFFLSGNNTSDFATYWVAYVFAAASSTIVSGSLAERTQFHAYLIFTAIMTGFIYPIVSHWVYSDHGWLNDLNYIVWICDILLLYNLMHLIICRILQVVVWFIVLEELQL